MKFSLTGQESVTFKCMWLLNRGDRMDRHDCIWFSKFYKIELGASILHISVIFLLDLGTFQQEW